MIASRRFAPAVFVAMFAASTVPPVDAADAERVVNIAMEDQFKNRHETLRYRGDVVVLVYAERKGAEARSNSAAGCTSASIQPRAAPATEWSRQPVVAPAGWPAARAAPDVHVIPVACLPEVPKALETVARSRFRKDSPFVSVWLDFEDTMRQRFGIVPNEPNVVLLDTRGCPQGVVSGHLDEVRFGEVVSAIDQLRLTSLQDRTAAMPAAATVVR